MDQGLIPRRYARALFKAARERSQEKQMYQLTGRLAESFINEPRLNEVMANPFIDAADKTRLIYTAAGADPKSDSLFSDFLSLLIKNRRLDMIRDIAIAYRDIYRRENKISRVTVTSAAPLAPTVEQRLKALIEKHLPAGGSMEYRALTDPSLIGGFTIAIDNQRLDASVANELKQLQLSLITR